MKYLGKDLREGMRLVASSDITSNTDELTEGTFTAGSLNNNTSSEFNTATTANQTLTNMNDQ